MERKCRDGNIQSLKLQNPNFRLKKQIKTAGAS